MTMLSTVAGRRVTRLLVLVSLAALSLPIGVGPARASGAPGHVRVWPKTGPVGTLIHYRGHLRGQLFSRSELRDPDGRILRGLYTDVPGCEILVNGTENHLAYNPGTRIVAGSMRIPATGHCNQSTADHAVTPGHYWLTIGCMTCVVGGFTVTADSTSLPFTGPRAAAWPTAQIGLAIVVIGLILLRLGRPRHH